MGGGGELRLEQDLNIDKKKQTNKQKKHTRNIKGGSIHPISKTMKWQYFYPDQSYP